MFWPHAATAGIEPTRDPHCIKFSHQMSSVIQPLGWLGQRHPRGNKSHATCTAHKAGEFASGIFLDLAIDRISACFVDLRRLESGCIHIGVVINRLDRHRVIRRHTIELFQRETTRVIRELLFRPAAQGHHPLARLGPGQTLGEHFERLLTRGHAIKTQFVMFGGADPVRVIIDEARYHRTALKIDDLCSCSGLFAHLGILTDRDDATTFDRHCLLDPKLIVNRDDLAIHENQISLTRLHRQTHTEQTRCKHAAHKIYYHDVLRDAVNGLW